MKDKDVIVFDSEFFASRLLLKQRAFYMSVRDAAKEIGVSASTLSRLNRAKFIPDVYTYFLCCRWLEVQMNFFFKKTLNNQTKQQQQ